MKLLFLAWQDPVLRRWHTVGRLTEEAGCYRFEYTSGAQDAQQVGFCPLPSFPDLRAVYESAELFPLFTNRLLSPSRPDYAEFVEWLSLGKHEKDPFALLARSGGRRATDTLAVFLSPERDQDGSYHVHFFLHGLSHQLPEVIKRAEILSSGEPLLLMKDIQNPKEPRAIALRASETYSGDMAILGYCPQYLLEDLDWLLSQPSDARNAVSVTVERVNPAPAPVQFRVLCCMVMQWPDGFQPFSSAEYQPINSVSMSNDPAETMMAVKELVA